MSETPDPAVHCWDDLPYVTALEHTCGHTVEIHTLVQPDLVEFVPLTAHPCIWCHAVAQGASPELVDTVNHQHFMYRRGDAVIRRTILTLEEFNVLREMAQELAEEGDSDG